MPSIRALGASFAHHDAVPLFESADFVLTSGWTGLVGPNGAGKTTLLRLLAGELRPNSGSLRFEPERPLVHLCPQRVDEPDEAVVDLAWDASGPALRLKDELSLDFEMLQRWPSLSPGERKRWQIGSALARLPDILLLDEPTNHLDANARDRLLRALRRFNGVGVVVSHDRALLTELTERTLWIEAGEIEVFRTGYGDARAQRDEAYTRSLETLTRAQEAQRRLERRLAEARDDQRRATASRSTGKRMRNRHDSDARTLAADFHAEQAQKRIGRQVGIVRREAARAAQVVDTMELRKELGRGVFLDWEPAPKSTLVALDRAAIAAGERTLLSDVHLVVGRNDRIHVAGPNGAGKSTLVRAILDAAQLPPEKVLHLPQELSPDDGRAVLAAVCDLPPDERGRVLSLVAALGLDPSRLLATADPSPGEARKVWMALGMARHAWILILDEPTNHLDLPAIERLEEALRAWPGALILVTHDGPLAERCTDRRWQIREGRLEIGSV